MAKRKRNGTWTSGGKTYKSKSAAVRASHKRRKPVSAKAATNAKKRRQKKRYRKRKK